MSGCSSCLLFVNSYGIIDLYPFLSLFFFFFFLSPFFLSFYNLGISPPTLCKRYYSKATVPNAIERISNISVDASKQKFFTPGNELIKDGVNYSELPCPLYWSPLPCKAELVLFFTCFFILMFVVAKTFASCAFIACRFINESV